MSLINNSLFYVSNSVIYPPFKNGYYLEEYFYNHMLNNNIKYDNKGRLYIPSLWTNFQIEGWFNNKKYEMQEALDEFISNNYCENGYFTIVQYDDGPLLKLPENTIIYGACSGTIPIPLIYQDNNNILKNMVNKSFNDKNILCSFVGTLTHTVRNYIVNTYINNPNFIFQINHSWSPHVSKNLQDNFINLTINSKFCLAPRGYGRSSFRFFEIFLLGSIPIYIYDDIEWLPYKDIIDYSKFCISLNINQLNDLENILLNITEDKYNNMLYEYNNIKYMFELEFMKNYILNF